MPIAFKDLCDAFDFVASDLDLQSSVRINRATGELHWFSEIAPELEPQPDDVDDDAKYISVPSARALDLGRSLVMRFAAERLPAHYDEIDEIFRRKGAYRRFRDFLIRRRALDAWRAFEEEAKEEALRAWCAQEGLAVEG